MTMQLPQSRQSSWREAPFCSTSKVSVDHHIDLAILRGGNEILETTMDPFWSTF